MSSVGAIELNRRSLLAGMAAVSATALAEGCRLSPGAVNMSSNGLEQFTPVEVKTADNTVFIRRYGKGPALLLVHGFPRTSLMWRFLAPKLAENHTVICADLRGYGRSGTPSSTDDHAPYTKRAMAAELVSVMEQLGFPRFGLIGHDRGGRVSYRMALDHADRIERLAVFDVIPIIEAWELADDRFAKTYWPWILLSQKAPLPEKYLRGAPEAVFENPFGTGTFTPEVLEEYVSMYRDPVRVHAVCEEYRAAATADIEHDRADRESGKRIQCPMLHLWAEGGPLDTLYGKQGGSLGIWRKWAPRAVGQSMSGGHFFPEENAADTARLLKPFLSA